MRRWHILWLAAAMAACSSSPTVPGPPPPPPPPPAPGAPVSVTVVAGDGQTGGPGVALPVALSVVVKDGNGTPVPAVVVHFAIDSGGGSLSTTAVITGTNGVAAGVTWTLGGSGVNVVAVSVGSLPLMRFHAQATGAIARTVVDHQVVGASGGTVSYTKTGDPLSGLIVTVPANAYTAPSTWTIMADSTIAVPLPSGFALVGPPLVIGNGQGFADSTMTLTMPMRLGNTVAAAPFYYDPATRLFEPITLVDRTDTSATLSTKHFSIDQLALPNANGTSALRAQLHSGFGNVVVVWVQTPLSQLVGGWNSGFQPGTDDWEFVNYGDYIGPDGDCEGMSITAMYYYYSFRRGAATAPGLYHRYDKSLANQWDNLQGIRFAGSVQGDFSVLWDLGFNQDASLTAAAVARGANVQLLTSSWIALSIKLTHQPVLMHLRGPKGAHAVVAYAVAVSGLGFTTVSIANPNNPGTTQFLNFTAGVFQPVNVSTVAGASPDVYNQAYAVGVSTDLPIPVIALRWLQFRAGAAGADRYPAGYFIEMQNKYSGLWHTVGGHRIISFDSTMQLRTNCAGCLSGAPAKPIEPVTYWDDQAASPIGGGTTLFFTAPATASFWAVESGYDGTSNRAGFLDSDSLEWTWQKVDIDGPGTSPPNKLLTFTVTNPPNLAGAHYTFQWDFGDGTATVTKNDNPVVTHTFTTSATFTVSLTIMVTGTTEPIYQQNLKQRITADIVWGFSQVTQTATTLPAGGIGVEHSDTVVQGLINGFMANLTSNPTSSLLFLYGAPTINCHTAVLEEFSGTTPQTTDSLVVSAARAILAGDCDLQPNTATTLTLGPLGNGPVTGTASDSPQLPPDEMNLFHGGSITATMTGALLNGSVTWNVLYSNGMAVYRFTFSAVQEVP
jgi:PKD domain